MDIITEELGKNLIMTYKGETIQINLFEMKEGQVKLGIDAPKGISVDREEMRKNLKTIDD